MGLTHWTAVILLLSLASSGCSTPGTADPLGNSRGSMFSWIIPRRHTAAHTMPEATSDPFMQSERNIDLNALGRTSLTDSAPDNTPPSDAAGIAAQPVSHTGQPLFPAGTRDPDAAAAEQATHLILQSQLQRASREESAAQRRLRELELELQLTDDHATQDQLALEIARLRRKMPRSKQSPHPEDAGHRSPW